MRDGRRVISSEQLTMDNKKKYKKTEIGEIPVDWEVRKLEEIADIIMGQSPKSSSYNDEGYGLPFFQGKTEFGEIYPNIKKWCSQPIKISEPNDILLSVRAPVGDVNINNVKACIGRGLAAIRYTKHSNFKFLFYILKRYKQEFEKNAQGSTFTAINSNDIKNLKIPVPPLQEQQKIASILSTVDEYIEQTDALIEKTKELKKGLMQKLLTKGIGHNEFKNTEIGEIPKEWEVKKLGDCGVCITGVSYKPKDLYDSDKDCTIRLLRSNNINEKIILNEIQFVNINRVKSEQILKNGDIVICMSNGSKRLVGKSALFKVQDGHAYTIGVFCSIFRVKNDFDKDFISYLFNSIYYNKEIRILLSGTSINNLKKSDITNIKIPIPPLKEQQKIASILSEVDNKIQQYELKKEKLQNLKKGFMQKLLTGKIRVKI
ncbi:restriction endonuclease subunit S [Caloranaerobacter azorensis]|uniref:Restriction endonuclease subunit S n=1 Tax=Caloranaerobacter azorensis TaxID=116090 RepID=A0A6P1YFR1_9FIRM|nr:restriction endonuclease subunit S [Caloranaerobacter azorensis]QIB27025.1 restriction endonuclease subunit S [Caloranaerobacter azorensis]